MKLSVLHYHYANLHMSPSHNISSYPFYISPVSAKWSQHFRLRWYASCGSPEGTFQKTLHASETRSCSVVSKARPVPHAFVSVFCGVAPMCIVGSQSHTDHYHLFSYCRTNSKGLKNAGLKATDHLCGYYSLGYERFLYEMETSTNSK